MGRLSERTAVIFGADAIGRGIASRFVREGGRVVLLDQAELVAVAPDGTQGFAIDPHDKQAIAQVFARIADALGPVHILVNNLLPQPVIGPLDAQDDAAMAGALDSVRACALAMRAVFPGMREAGWGRIVIIGHRYGESVNEGITAYNAAAWALVGLTRSAALDWGRWQIATNLLLPFADTPELRAAQDRRPRVIDLMMGQIPLGRAGDPVDDIGAAAAFLACDEAAFVNGQIIYADGGQHVAGPVLNPVRFAD